MGEAFFKAVSLFSQRLKAAYFQILSNFLANSLQTESVEAHWPLVLEVMGSIPAQARKDFGVQTCFP